MSWAATANTSSTAGPISTDQIWNTWNADTSPRYIPEAGISLTARTVFLEARMGAAYYPTYFRCVDSMWDWQVAGGTTTHFDARVLRNCRANTIYQWNKPESVPPAGDPYVFIGEQKSGLCYLSNPSNSGEKGQNTPPGYGARDAASCFASVSSSAALGAMESNVWDGAKCVTMRIFWASSTPVTYNSSNPRRCDV